MLRSGSVAGRRLANGVWLIDGDAVARYEMTATRGSGRTLDASTAWGLLWELSGEHAAWLSPSTRTRVRRRIRESSATELVNAVARRTTAHYYTAANVEHASKGLILTGRAAAEVLGSALIDDHRRVCGYVASGSVDEYARSNFMVENPSGHDVLYENTLPVAYPRSVMPSAVIAADLSTSTDTRERNAGLRAIESMRRQWLAAR